MGYRALSWSVGWPAPAKINHFLHIVGRRADGYHQLETAFQFLALADGLAFCPRDDGVIQRVDAASLGGDDLAVRAARLLAERGASDWGVDIHIDKHIPAGGGLGGGSSDAATTLVGLNQLWGLRRPLTELAALGLQLGADVPVFVHGENAWAEGVGEQLYPLAMEPAWLVLVDPGVSVSTGECFAAPELTREQPHSRMQRLRAVEQVNAFEPVVRQRYPAVASALDWLGERLPARLSGSGGCCFAIGSSQAEVERIAAEVPAPWRGIATRALERSPLSQRLAPATGVDTASRANGA